MKTWLVPCICILCIICAINKVIDASWEKKICCMTCGMAKDCYIVDKKCFCGLKRPPKKAKPRLNCCYICSEEETCVPFGRDGCTCRHKRNSILGIL